MGDSQQNQQPGLVNLADHDAVDSYRGASYPCDNCSHYLFSTQSAGSSIPCRTSSRTTGTAARLSSSSSSPKPRERSPMTSRSGRLPRQPASRRTPSSSISCCQPGPSVRCSRRTTGAQPSSPGADTSSSTVLSAVTSVLSSKASAVPCSRSQLTRLSHSSASGPSGSSNACVKSSQTISFCSLSVRRKVTNPKPTPVTLLASNQSNHSPASFTPSGERGSIPASRSHVPT